MTAFNERFTQVFQGLNLDDIHHPTTKIAATRGNWVVGWKNGIRIEAWATRKDFRVLAAWDQSVRDELWEIFPDIFEDCGKGKGLIAHFGTNEPKGTEFIATLVEEIQKLGLENTRRTGKARTDDNAYFEKTAEALKAIIEIEAWDFLTRETFDQHDNLITLGKSQAVVNNPDDPTWREHLVPCTMILDHAVEMVQAGATVPELAQMLKENLAILIITQEEAKKVDALYQTTMPKDWTWGQTVFARLDAVGVTY